MISLTTVPTGFPVSSIPSVFLFLVSHNIYRRQEQQDQGTTFYLFNLHLSHYLATSVKEREITVLNTCHLGNILQPHAGLRSHMQQYTSQCGLMQANTIIYGLVQVNTA